MEQNGAMGVAMLERPVYGVGQAAELLGLGAPKVRNWLDGYQRGARMYPPVIREESTGSDFVTWGEFVELGYLREFRRAGVSLQRMRPVIEGLRQILGTKYPLAHHDLYVSHREVVVGLQKEHDVAPSAHMVLRTGQGVLELSDRAKAFLRKVEFDPIAVRLMPAGKESPVRVDPDVAFGMPSVRAVSTERLFEAWSTEDENIDWVARAYDLEPALVRAAVTYEETARSRAA